MGLKVKFKLNRILELLLYWVQYESCNRFDVRHFMCVTSSKITTELHAHGASV